MRFLLSLLAFAVFTTAVLTACNSSAQSNRQQAENKTSNANTAAGYSQTTTNASSSHSAGDGHNHEGDGITRISVADAKRVFDEGNALFVDTRSAATYEAKHIKGALNIPAEEFQTRYAEMPKDKKIITYCS
jgi:3-mercaptopyruvate sulfurtransferase SseA